MKAKTLKKTWQYAAIAALFLFLANASDAQNDGRLEAVMNEISSLYTSKLEEAFRKNQPRAERMNSELEEVEKIKENQGRNKALENYSRNHKAQYGQMMKEAGVNPNAVVARLKSKFPDFSFSIVDDYSIMVEQIKNETDGSTGGVFPQGNGQADPERILKDERQTGGIPYPATSGDHVFAGAYTDPGNNRAGGPMADVDFETGHPNPAVVYSGITSTQELSFAPRRLVNCALASGGSVELGTRHVKATSTGAVGGECKSTGWLENSVVLPATGVQSVKLRLNSFFEVNAFALGILGAAVSSSDCFVNYMIVDQVSERRIGQLSRFVVAPIFWYGSFNQANSWSTYLDLTPFRGKTLKVTGLVVSYSLAAVCCATNATSRLTFNAANLEIVR